jgi:putative protease
VEQVTRVWRAAIDAYQANPEAYQVKAEWDAQLARVSEGARPPSVPIIASGNKEPCS